MRRRPMNQASVYLCRLIGKTPLFLIFWLALSCGGPTQMTVLSTYSPPVIDAPPIPLRAGLVVTKNFRTASAAGGYNGVGFMATIGPALTQAAGNMVRRAFKDTVIINVDEATKIDAISVPAGIDVLVIPVIKNVSAPIRRIGGAKEGWFAQVVIRWNILKDGQIVYMNTFTGESRKYGERMDESLALALKDHFDQAYRGIVTSNWWRFR
jgi:hypothetical protein